ncbi:MAG: hypothetical protein ACRDMV_04525 [Streptosporangiales bacterium]
MHDVAFVRPVAGGTTVRDPRAPRPWVAYAGAAWAASYLPVHLYWASGGAWSTIGIDSVSTRFALANIAACIVIAGAGLTCLSLVQGWGSLLPGWLRHGTAWFGAIFGLLHAAVFGAAAIVRLVDDHYPAGGTVSAAQLRAYDIANLVYFEPWFAVMGGLLIACSLYGRRHRLAVSAGHGTYPLLASALLLAGVVACVLGTYAFQVWLFVGVGPALLLAGSAVMVGASRRERREATR